MRIPATLVIAGAAFLAGCASTWDKPGATTQDFNKDSYECERDMRQSNTGTGILGAIEAKKFYGRCMVARGWHERDG